MADESAQDRFQSLVDGFNALTEEYQRVWAKSQALERGLLAARSEFTAFVAQRGVVSKHDLADFPCDAARYNHSPNPASLESTEDWWRRNDVVTDKNALNKIRVAAGFVQLKPSEGVINGRLEKITSTGSSTMPSISESPLEQDFTTSGTPSKLGCPFASMTNRKLGTHAASVVSKYRPNGSITARSSVSRVNGRASSVAQASLQAETKAPEVCGAMELPKMSAVDMESVQGSAVALCPIRFLEKSSPEEIATYFEEHKHELPRSHEVCVKRYQSNADSIRELDAKYGNIVSMLQGLGQKHKPMLPNQPGSEDLDEEEMDRASADRVRKWASDVSNVNVPLGGAEVDDEERKPHFDRPMRDVRIGESPSRPWGIQVPISALEAPRRPSAFEPEVGHDLPKETKTEVVENGQKDGGDGGAGNKKPAGKCPFHFDVPKAVEQSAVEQPPKLENTEKDEPVPQQDGTSKDRDQVRSIFVSPQGTSQPTPAGMTFTGPVFIGYSPEQAVAMLQALKGQRQ
ncbi:hypothetical protein MBLNU457_g1101t2 [Dothideomycetes sp. NU457]